MGYDIAMKNIMKNTNQQNPSPIYNHRPSLSNSQLTLHKIFCRSLAVFSASKASSLRSWMPARLQSAVPCSQRWAKKTPANP